MTYDYNKKLYEDYKKIRDKVERGMLPLVARIPAIDRATTEYAIALAEHYHANQAAGKNPPVPLKNAALLDRFADLVMWEELKWSHPDKMSIVEYPVMSDTQAERRDEKQPPRADLSFGDLEEYVWRRAAQVGWGLRIVGYDAEFIELWTDYVDQFKRWWEATSCGPR